VSGCGGGEGGTDEFALVLLHEIHLMDETEDLGFGRELEDGLQTRLVVMHVFLEFARLDVKDIDQDLDVSEDILRTREC
jgi:signal transduction histidine kinase